MIEQILFLGMFILSLTSIMWGIQLLIDKHYPLETDPIAASILPEYQDSSVYLPEDRTPVEIDYTNWKGERSTRLIYVYQFYWGVSEYHPTPGYLIEGWDLEKQAARTFSMSGIHSWKEVTS